MLAQHVQGPGFHTSTKRKKMRDLNPNKPAVTLKEPIISIKRQKS
jgi:hypothetical protein